MVPTDLPLLLIALDLEFPSRGSTKAGCLPQPGFQLLKIKATIEAEDGWWMDDRPWIGGQLFRYGGTSPRFENPLEVMGPDTAIFTPPILGGSSRAPYNQRPIGDAGQVSSTGTTSLLTRYDSEMLKNPQIQSIFRHSRERRSQVHFQIQKFAILFTNCKDTKIEKPFFT